MAETFTCDHCKATRAIERVDPSSGIRFNVWQRVSGDGNAGNLRVEHLCKPCNDIAEDIAALAYTLKETE